MQVRNPTHVLLSLLVVGVWGLLASRWLVPDAHAGGLQGTGKQVIDELTVQRINIVDGSGKTRIVIANAERFPDPVVRGKPVPRSIRNAAGMVFFDNDGNETGGVATMRGPAGHEMAGLILDYTHQPTDGIGIVKSESKDGEHFTAGLTIADRLPYKPGDIETSGGISRIWLANSDRDAALEIADTAGKPRIRIGVDRNDKPSFQVLDADGKIVKTLLAD